MVLHKFGLTFVWCHPQIPSSVLVLTAGIAFLGAYMTICFCEQFRLQKLGNGQQKSKLLSRNQVFLLMACAMGGVATWAMNFINLFGMKLYITQFSPPLLLKIAFLLWPSMISLVVAVVFSFVGLYVGAQDTMFAKSKQEIVEQFVAHSSKLTFKEIQKITNLRMIFIISTQSWWSLVLGGIISGTGTIVTCCLSFSAIKIVYTNPLFNVGAIAGVTVLSWVLQSVSFWILFRLLSLYPHMEVLRLVSAALMAFNVYIVRHLLYNSMKFHVIHDINATINTFTFTKQITQAGGYNGTLIAAIVFSFALVLIAFSDLRSWLYDKSARVAMLESLMENLKKESPQNCELITAHLKRHEKLHSLSHDLVSSNHQQSEHNGDDVNKKEEKTVSSLLLSFVKHGFSNNSVSPTPRSSSPRSPSSTRSRSGSSSPRKPLSSARASSAVKSTADEETPCETPVPAQLSLHLPQSIPMTSEEEIRQPEEFSPV